MRSSRWQAQGNVYLVAEHAADRGAGPRARRRRRRLRRGARPRRTTGFRSRSGIPTARLAEMSGNGTRIAAALARGADRRPRGHGLGRRARSRRHGRSLTAASSRSSGAVVVGEAEEVDGIRFTPGRRRQPACRGRRRPQRDRTDRPPPGDAPPVPEPHERSGCEAPRPAYDRGSRVGARRGRDRRFRHERDRYRRRPWRRQRHRSLPRRRSRRAARERTCLVTGPAEHGETRGVS